MAEHMSAAQYVAARKTLGLRVGPWLEKLGISSDTHKSYSSGRLAIQAPVANHISTLLELAAVKKSQKNEKKP